MTNIIITGASRGIGFETVRTLCADSNNQIIAISRNTRSLDHLKQECNKINKDNRLVLFPMDITSEEDQVKLKKIVFGISSIDILINIAGLLVNEKFINIDQETAKEMFNVNFFGPLALIKTITPFMGLRKKGHIVNIGSMGGFQGSAKFAGLSYYSASKAALACMSECLASEFAEYNIAVNCLALGAVQTEMLREAFPGYSAPVNASDMGKFIADFALKGMNYFNGKVLPVALSTP